MIPKQYDQGEVSDVAGLNEITVLIDRSCTARAELGLNTWAPGQDGLPHQHEAKEQVFFVVAGSGSLRIALQNADGSAREGFGLEDCDPIQGDFLRTAVTWKGKSDLDSSGTVRLKIHLQNADLYALQFADQVIELPNRVPHLDGLSLPLKTEQANRKAP